MTDRNGKSSTSLKPAPFPGPPYYNKRNVVETELFPAFSPYASTHELPPSPIVDP
jgi:hypothetical protein